MVCTMWTNFMGGVAREGSRKSKVEEDMPPIFHGFLAARQREDAMEVQRCLGGRLRAKKM